MDKQNKATIGEGCTILHGVTLGGTGKDHGDRHPKVGNNVLIGAGSLLLGKIRIGDCAKIGAASVLLRDIPAHATAVGSPARIVGRATEVNPGKEVDIDLQQVRQLGRTASDSSSDTTVTASLTDVSSIISGLYISGYQMVVIRSIIIRQQVAKIYSARMSSFTSLPKLHLLDRLQFSL
jgi:hypothetical protein